MSARSAIGPAVAFEIGVYRCRMGMPLSIRLGVIGAVAFGASGMIDVPVTPPPPAAGLVALPANADERIRALLADGQYIQAEALARLRLRAVEAAGGADGAPVADAIQPVVEAIWRGGLFERGDALALAERAVALNERYRGTQDAATLVSVSNEAELFDLYGNFARARPLHERVLREREVLFGPTDPAVAEALERLATHRMVGFADLAVAKAQFERALAIWQTRPVADDLNVALALADLAWVARRASDGATGKRLAEQSLAIRERTLGPDHPDVAESLRVLGDIFYWSVGDASSALRCYRRARTILLARFGPESLLLANVHVSMWAALIDVGSYTETRELLEHGLPIHERALGGSSYFVGVDVFGLAVAAEELDDEPRALELFERARTIFESNASPAFAATCTRRVASLLAAHGETERAQGLFEQALETQERVVGPNHPEVSATLFDYGRLLQAKGDRAKATQLLRRALGIQQRNLGPEHPWLAMTYNALGQLQAEQGNLDQAEATGRKALRILERSIGPDAPETSEQRLDLARIHWMAQRAAEAQSEALLSEISSRTLIRRLARNLSEREALHIEQDLDASLDLALTTLAELGPEAGSARQVWDELIRSRILVLDEMTARHRVLFDSGSPSIAGRADALERARAQLAHVVAGRPDMAHPEAYRESLAKARSSMEQAERELAEASEAFRKDLDRDDARLDDVLAALPAGAALVSFVRYDAIPSRLPPSATWPASGIPSYLALIAVPGARSFSVVPLGAADDVDGEIHRWATEASSPPLDRDADERYLRAGTSLRRMIWDPVIPYLHGAREVFLVLDGELHAVSFETLPTAANRFVVDGALELHYLDAEKDLVGPPVPSPRGAGGALLVGGPDYGETLSPLEGAQTEVTELARMLRDAPVGSAGGRSEVVTLTGPEATEAAFKRLAPGKGLIHIATHGFSLPSPPSDAREDAPPVVTGLAFAGANPGKGGPAIASNDGLLTADEVATLDLRAAEWVVLSACDSGTGPAQRGEGVLGLRRAFRVAGASHLVTSLWPVADNLAVDWMRSLYEARRTGACASTAVREASRRQLETRRRERVSTHPFYWGSFIETGSPN